MKILLDIDGVIANFFYGFAIYLKNSGINLDPEKEPDHYNISEWSNEINSKDVKHYILNWLKKNGYKDLPIFDGAQEFVYRLMDGNQVYIVTARVGGFNGFTDEAIKNKIKVDTIHWFKKHGIPSNDIYFEHDKLNFCKKNGINVMIEDKLSTVVEAANEGIFCILKDAGYNRNPERRNHPNIFVAYNYEDILNKIKELE